MTYPRLKQPKTVDSPEQIEANLLNAALALASDALRDAAAIAEARNPKAFCVKDYRTQRARMDALLEKRRATNV